jgi:hypothetical protein
MASISTATIEGGFAALSHQENENPVLALFSFGLLIPILYPLMLHAVGGTR